MRTRPWWHKALVFAGAGCMSAALVLQYVSSGVRTHYSVMAAMLLGCFSALWYCAPRLSRREAIAAMLWGTGMALAMVMGEALRKGIGLLPGGSLFKLLLRLGGLALVFATVLGCFMAWRPARTEMRESCSPSRTEERRWFLIAWAIIVLCWLPYWLYFFPCIISEGDILMQYQQTLTGQYDNAHPILHTLSLGLSTQIASLLGGGGREGFAGYALVQLIVMGAAFAWLSLCVRQSTRRRWAALASVAYFALNPLHAAYAITLWKDTPFGVLVAILCALLLQVARTRGKCLTSRGFFSRLVAVLAVLPFTRTNGIIVSMGVLMALLLWRAAITGKRLLIAAVAILSGFLLIQGPVLNALNVNQPRATEVLSIPLAQIGRVANQGAEIPPEQRTLIDRVIPLEALAQAYDPGCVNPIKLHPEFQYEELRGHLWTYAGLWVSLGARFPRIYAEAYGQLTYPLWYPDQLLMFDLHWNNVISPWSDFALMRPLVPQLSFLWKLDVGKLSQQYPALTLLFGVGIQIWYLLAACACLLARKRRRYLLPMLPLLAVWIPLALATPIVLTRYVYAFYCALPVTLCLLLQSKQSEDALCGDFVASV